MLNVLYTFSAIIVDFEQVNVSWKDFADFIDL